MTGKIVNGAMALCLLTASPALADVRLVQSTPAADAVLAAPKTLKLTFSEKVAPALTGVTLSMSDGMAISAKTSLSDDGLTLTARPTSPFMAGQWTATWHATGEDGRQSKGAFNFTVK